MLYFAMEDDGLIDFSYDVFLEKLKTEQYRKSCFYILMQNKYEYIVDISAIRGLSGAEAVQYDLDARPANLTYKEFNDNLFIEESLRTTFDKRKIINLYGFCCNWAECSPQQFAKKMESEEYSQVVYEFIKSRVSAIGFPKTRDDFTNELKCLANN